MTIENLRMRSLIIRDIRKFFAERGVLEVETPILSQARVSDVHLDSFKTEYFGKDLYLNTSPEYHMKRLLASGSGPIFQICKCFRYEETSSKHNPEFTMLEWYRVGFTLQRLLDEVEDLFRLFFAFEKLERYSYEFIFETYLGISPLEASHNQLVELAAHYGLHQADSFERDAILEFLFSIVIEPNLGMENPVAIYNYPASQAALAQLTPEDNRTAQRAEVFFRGMELANGFFELTDFEQQYYRFLIDQNQRRQANKEEVELDKRFLKALKEGLPESSGIALGLDRLILLVLQDSSYFLAKDKRSQPKSISDVMTFNIHNA